MGAEILPGHKLHQGEIHTGAFHQIFGTASAGIYPSIAEGVKRCARADRTFLPNPENHEIYEEMYGPWSPL
mgnify:CR=1 FL=1